MPKLENKVVLITGASSGFGEDAAMLFAQEGCGVVLAGAPHGPTAESR